MKRLILLMSVLVFGSIMLIGCGTKEINQTKVNTSDNTTNNNYDENTTKNEGSNEVSDNTMNNETAFYLENEQFMLPKSGDTVAEIIVKDFGSIYVKFFDNVAPKAVENFITHSKEGYYDGLTFHRVINDFMIQGGDPNGTGIGGESIWGEDFEDEFADNLQPYRGALCMANSGPNTNGSQFFIVQSKQVYDSKILKQIEDQYGVTFDESSANIYNTLGGTPWLYRMHTVFGQVYDGLDVLDAIAAVDVDGNSKPNEAVIIEKINIFKYQ